MASASPDTGRDSYRNEDEVALITSETNAARVICHLKAAGRLPKLANCPRDMKFRQMPMSERVLRGFPATMSGRMEAQADRTKATPMIKTDIRLPVEIKMDVIRVSCLGTRAGPWSASQAKPVRQVPRNRRLKQKKIMGIVASMRFEAIVAALDEGAR